MVQGRMLYDVILYPGRSEWLPPGYDQSKRDDARVVPWLALECDRGELDRIRHHLLQYRLRSKVDVDLEGLSNLQVHQYIPGDDHGEHVHVAEDPPRIPSQWSSFPDPRVSGLLGHRVLVSADQLSSLVSSPLSSSTTATIGAGSSSGSGSAALLDRSSHHYFRLRYQLGVPEGVAEFPPGLLLPQQMNVDYMDGSRSWSGWCLLVIPCPPIRALTRTLADATPPPTAHQPTRTPPIYS